MKIKLYLLIWIAFMIRSLSADGSDDYALKTRIQFGAIKNDNASENIFPTGFLNFDEGLNLNRAELILEKVPQ
ncbi:MAG: hypothetical protein AB2797_03035, partial [Candidatus Thiodiazotropha sp.]